jgi:biopolymer transport protein ExbB
MMPLFSENLRGMLVLGGPVVWILILMSVIALAAVFFKLWQFWQAGVGRHAPLDAALDLWDAGQATRARAGLDAKGLGFAPVLAAAFAADHTAAAADRIDALAYAALARLEGGFRLLDSISQTAPLLGLFGTVLGMIEAFQAMQGAGTSVDPSVLAGGIWVALLTTAVGLAVAIPTSLMLTWCEAQVAGERQWIAGALARLRAPVSATGALAGSAPGPVASQAQQVLADAR